MAEAAAAYKEGDEAREALFGETEDEAEENAGSDESPLCWRRRGPAPPRPRSTNNEAEDTAAAPRPHPADNEGEDLPCSTKAPPAGNEIEDITGSAEAPPHCQ